MKFLLDNFNSFCQGRLAFHFGVVLWEMKLYDECISYFKPLLFNPPAPLTETDIIMLLGTTYGESGDESLKANAYRTVFRRKKQQSNDRHKSRLKQELAVSDIAFVSTFFNILHPRPTGSLSFFPLPLPPLHTRTIALSGSFEKQQALFFSIFVVTPQRALIPSCSPQAHIASMIKLTSISQVS
jgi:hypothetical protein